MWNFQNVIQPAPNPIPNVFPTPSNNAASIATNQALPFGVMPTTTTNNSSRSTNGSESSTDNPFANHHHHHHHSNDDDRSPVKIPLLTQDQFKNVDLPPLPKELLSLLNHTNHQHANHHHHHRHHHHHHRTPNTNTNHLRAFVAPSFSNLQPNHNHLLRINHTNGHAMNGNHGMHPRQRQPWLQPALFAPSQVPQASQNMCRQPLRPQQPAFMHNIQHMHTSTSTVLPPFNAIHKQNGMNGFQQHHFPFQPLPLPPPPPPQVPPLPAPPPARGIPARKPTQNRIKLKLRRPPRMRVSAIASTNHDLPPAITVPIVPVIPRTTNGCDSTEVVKECESEETTTTKTPQIEGEPRHVQSEAEGQDDAESECAIDKTQHETLADELCVDVHGVKWDNTVNWLCGVCEGADAQQTNALVVCEGCCRAVHEACYGIAPTQLSSDDDWYCMCCRFKRYILHSNTIPLQQLRDLYAQHAQHAHAPADAQVKSVSLSPSPLLQQQPQSRSSLKSQWSVNRLQQFAADNTPSTPHIFNEVPIPLNVLRDHTTVDTFFNGKPLPKCSLCCTLGGSYKLSKDGRWVHMSCSLYHPNVYFDDHKYLNAPVLSDISMDSSHAVCALCHSASGACIQCTSSPSPSSTTVKCSQWMHVTCMQQHRLYLFYDEERVNANAPPLTAFCAQHTQAFKQRQTAGKQHAAQLKPTLSGRKRRRNELASMSTAGAAAGPRKRYKRKTTKTQRDGGDGDYVQGEEDGDNEDEYKPQRKPRARSRGGSTRKPRQPKSVPFNPVRPFSPEPDAQALHCLHWKLDAYMTALRLGGEDETAAVDSENEVSSVSSLGTQQAAAAATAVDTPKAKPRLRRRKSAVNLLSHSSFSLKRGKNKWLLNKTYHLYPNREQFCESKDGDSASEPDDNDEQQTQAATANPNHWTLETTTDSGQRVAEETMRSVETLWSHRQTNFLAKSQNSRDYRKAVGFSVLRNPTGDVITSCNWSFWEVSATKKAVLIKLFITEPYSKSRVPQRRKKNGTLLAAHLMDISFRCRDDVDWVVICSERGIAETFWRALGFSDFKINEIRGFCRGTDKDLNQFKDTILLRMQHSEYLQRYCDNATEWGDDNCAVQKVFLKWRKKHLFMNRNLVFKHKGNVVHTHKLPSY